MARMYSRKKGRSGSTKPIRKVPPIWLKYKPAEIEKLVVKLAKEGKSSAEIGTLLRDSYGIPDIKAVTNKKLLRIMRDNKVSKSLPEDLANLIGRVIDIETHMKANGKDRVGLRGIQLTESKIRRLVRYYKKKKVLPDEWTYSRSQAKFLLR